MKFVKEAFDSNWITPLGKNVDEFENEMCRYTGAPYAAALSSGTAAIHLALKYLGVGTGDIVFCSSLTFSGTCNPIDYVNATPVFIDSDYESGNMSAVALEKAYKKYPNPKAVIIVNLYGHSACYDKLLPITKKHGTPVIEDAAESLGAVYNGTMTGRFGDIAILSFNGNKIITTSGGGMALLDTKEAKEKFVFWATQSREKQPWYEHKEIGYNYRLSNVSAGIGRGQLMILTKRIEQKRRINKIYKEELSNLVEFFPTPVGSEPTYWLTVIMLPKTSKTGFMDIIHRLSTENIESRPFWKPMHTQPVFAKYDFFSHLDNGSVSEDMFSRGLCLPSDTKMTEEEVRKVAKIVQELVK